MFSYLDGGTGSYLFALIAGGAAGTWFALRTLFGRFMLRWKSRIEDPIDEVQE